MKHRDLWGHEHGTKLATPTITMSKWLIALAVMCSLGTVGCLDPDGDVTPGQCTGKCDGPAGSGYMNMMGSFEASPVDQPLQYGVLGMSALVVIPLGVKRRRKIGG